jgi:hypothetical protein
VKGDAIRKGLFASLIFRVRKRGWLSDSLLAAFSLWGGRRRLGIYPKPVVKSAARNTRFGALGIGKGEVDE